MAKKKNKNLSVSVIEKNVLQNSFLVILTNFRYQCVILTIICLILYSNTFNNGYALDDTITITSNRYVKDGFAGIKNIFTKEAYESSDSLSNRVKRVGLYRPLSIITFAIEQQIFGNPENNEITTSQNGLQETNTNLAHLRHVVNVLLYALSMLVLLYMLRLIIFRQEPLIAFIAAIIFAVHPIHTEVVANIKGRDEILSLLFICLTFIYTWKYKENNQRLYLFLSLLYYFLALLSKEYAITLIILIPLLFFLFKRYSIKNCFKISIPYLLVLFLYLAIRNAAVPFTGHTENNDIVTNAYLFAHGSQKAATIIATQLWYIKLLFFPHPLSCDYSYNQIPYTTFSDPLVWFSILVYTGIFITMVPLLIRRHLIAFGIAFFLLNWILISNLVINRGGTIGERLMYHSSLGFAILLAWLIYKIYESIKTSQLSKSAFSSLLVIFIVLCSVKTIARNADWENNFTLFLKDIQTSPNSIVLNYNAGVSYAMMADMPDSRGQRKELLLKAIACWSKALSIHHTYFPCYASRGTAYILLGEYEKGKTDLDFLKKYDPGYAMLPSLYATYYIQYATHTYADNGKYKEAIDELLKAVVIDPGCLDAWHNLAVLYASCKQYDKSMDAWQHVIAINPSDTKAQQQYILLLNRSKGKN